MQFNGAYVRKRRDVADNNRGVPLVSHRLFDDTFVVHEACGRAVVLSREDAIKVVRLLGEMVRQDPSPAKKQDSARGAILEDPPGVQTC